MHRRAATTTCRAAWALAVLSAALLLAAPLRAQEDEVAARAHFRAGVKRFDAKDYEQALTEFQTAYAARPSPTIARNVGLTQRALGRYADACTTLDDMLASPAGLKPDVVTATRRTIDEMRAKVAFVHVALRSAAGSAPVSATLSVDGEAVPAARVARGLYLSPGDHYFAARAAGYTEADKSETVTAGQEVTVDLLLASTGGGESGVVISSPEAPPPGVTLSAAPVAAPAPASRPPQRHRGWASVAVEGVATELPVAPALLSGGTQLLGGIGLAGHIAYQALPFLALGADAEANVLLVPHPANTTFSVSQIGIGPHVRLMTPNRVHLFLGVSGGLFLVGTSTQLPGETSSQASTAFTGFALGEAGVVVDVSEKVGVEVEGYGGVAGIDGSRKDTAGVSSGLYTSGLTWRAGGRAGVLFRF